MKNKDKIISCEIKVRKPKYPKGFFNTGYTKKWYKWFYSLPKNGDKIRLTWLPNPINNPSEKSCYIGSEGIVENMDESPLTDGSFDLKMETRIIMIIPRDEKVLYDYIKI